jgi:large subunit ribosomal protein L10e
MEDAMATLRPAKCYRKLERPYTRYSRKKPRESYVKSVPPRKIVKFEMGNPKGSYDLRGYLLAENGVQIRHNALEAARVSANKTLDKMIGKDNFFLKVLIFPHHVLRENQTATGAGADRFQTGMRLAFGKTIGTAARVKPGQRLLEIRVEKSRRAAAKEAFRRAAAKFPTTCRVEFEE